MKLKQVARIELKGRTGTKLDLAVSLTQSALPQKVAMPNLPPGAEVQLNSVAGTGKGTSVMRLDRAIPMSGKVNAKSKMDMTMELPAAGKMGMVTDIDLQVTFQGR